MPTLLNLYATHPLYYSSKRLDQNHVQQICTCLKYSNCTRQFCYVHLFEFKTAGWSPLQTTVLRPATRSNFFRIFPVLITELVHKFHIALYTWHADFSMQRIPSNVSMKTPLYRSFPTKISKVTRKIWIPLNLCRLRNSTPHAAYLVHFTDLYTAWKPP